MFHKEAQLLNAPFNSSPCPSCQHDSFKVIESRIAFETVRRRRKSCSACGHRETTYEVSQAFFVEAQSNAELLLRLKRALTGKDFPSSVLESSETSCLDCTYFEHNRCSFEFPEAGGSFARECTMFSPQGLEK
jgi:hypothetical protein